MGNREPDAELLEKLGSGLMWLRLSQGAWMAERPVKHSDEEFGGILEQCTQMEQALRSAGYNGCVLKEGHCPEDAIITCDHCAGISQEKEISDSPEPDQSGQMAMFQAYKGHP